MCGLDSERNCVHGSDSPQSAPREIAFFYNEISSAIRMPNNSLITGQERRIHSVTLRDRGYKVSPYAKRNCVHGSDTPQSARREIAFFHNEIPSGEAITRHGEL